MLGLVLEVQQAFSNDGWSDSCKHDKKISEEFLFIFFPYGNILWNQLKTNQEDSVQFVPNNYYM